MNIPPLDFNPTDLPESEQTPIVQMLVSVINVLKEQLGQQSEQLSKQSEKIDVLLSEIRQLKNLSKKPTLRPSQLPKDDDEPPLSSDESKLKRPGSSKQSKTRHLKIDREEIISVEDVPVGAIHKGYQDYVVQDLSIKPLVIKYRLERWQLPDGRYVIGKLPNALKGHHFGPTLRAYILHQHHHQCVTQPLLLSQLRQWNIEISSGQLNRILTEDKEDFHLEKSSILSAGLLSSRHIQVDDTGARHKGKNGYCTFIGNELFSWFESTGSKSRINFLELLRQGHEDYHLTDVSFAYMERHHVTPWIRTALRQAGEKSFMNAQCFEAHLNLLEINYPHYKRRVTEAALIGSIMHHGFSIDTVILSDDAGQFNVLQHALCWVHAERGIKSLPLSNALQVKAIEWARNEVWEIYQALRDYKARPSKGLQTRIENRFDNLCKAKTNYYGLERVLKRLFANKDELLLVLKRPDIPLHNNLSERDIREYVKRRKISGSTRSDEGRRCRDTFASLKKTALKMGVGFWDYLLDRLTQQEAIPRLDQLVTAALN